MREKCRAFAAWPVASGVTLRGFHALPAPEIYIAQYRVE